MNTTSHGNTFDICLKNAKAGDSESQYKLSLMFLNGDGVTKDEGAFERWALTAHENGHAGALYELAHYHRSSGSKMRADLTGDKFIDHKELAYSEFKILAEAGLLEAQEIPGEMYRFGEGFGIEPNREKAMYWYSIAASNGSEKATEILIYMGSHPDDAAL